MHLSVQVIQVPADNASEPIGIRDGYSADCGWEFCGGGDDALGQLVGVLPDE
jgi:hypothetical protein